MTKRRGVNCCTGIVLAPVAGIRSNGDRYPQTTALCFFLNQVIEMRQYIWRITIDDVEVVHFFVHQKGRIVVEDVVKKPVHGVKLKRW